MKAVPVKRRVDAVLIYPIPAFRMPETVIAISAVIDELKEFKVGHEPGRDLEIVKQNRMPGQLVVKAETGVAVVAYLIIAAFDPDERSAAGFGRQLRRVIFAVNGEQRIHAKGIFEVR